MLIFQNLVKFSVSGALYPHLCTIRGEICTEQWGEKTSKLPSEYLKYRRFTMLPVRIKARFSRLLRHPAWKRRGPVLISALHKFVSYGTYYLDTYALTYSPGCTWDTGSLNL